MELVDKIIMKNTLSINNVDIISQIIQNGILKTYQKNNFIYSEDEKLEYFYIIGNGKVEISKYTDKEFKKIFSFLTSGNFLGIPELFGEVHTVNAVCVCPCEIISIPKDYFFNHLKNDSVFIFDLLKNLGLQIGDFQKSIVIESAETKILNYLKWMSIKHGLIQSGIYMIPRKHTHEEIADFLSLSRETVTKTIHHLKESGILTSISKDHYFADKDLFEQKLSIIGGLVGLYGTDE
ncbi:MAG: hypothetical protein A2355_09640 [Spirochaetes bacterium RIFOXYB1_FULL_32_8]|nr:MAG: hypothetical protein A2Y30_01470 [Spirochaetes bacterium GWE1_32_154]OHD80918.1 MAG: hypothetical protein A2355_09640 [Spirochaetes bacterium RIFOXYB1_FULL_32_8]